MEICLSELIKRATQCLAELGLSAGTIRDYQCSAFRPLERRLKDQENINPETLLAQEEFFLGQYQDGKISRHTFNWRIRGIRVLTEVYETGTFTWKVFSKKEAISLSEIFETALCGFISKQNCGQRQKNCRQSLCRRFLKSLEDSGVTSFGDIRPNHVRSFIVKISETRAKSMDDVVYALRGFFRHLCENGLYHDTFWMLLAAPRCRDHHVRACLSSDEISLLLGSIGRETADGKRDFAAMSLAAVSGLRAGDIASLQMDDIDWKKHEIRLVQGKTSEPLAIPIPKVVLNAIADYILNGRPETTSRNVFVRHCAPYSGYHDGVSIACIFRKYQKKAGLSHAVGDGKTLHGMRRGVGTRMAADGVPVDMVAQVLGHKGTKATKQYISTDMQNLCRCTLGLDSLGGGI